MTFSFGDTFVDWLFLALRFIAAAGGFMAGWFIAGPLSQFLVWVVSRRQLPPPVKPFLKLAGGFALALLVFWYLPLGWGGGGGSGGGTGPGIGPFVGDSGTGKSGTKGPGEDNKSGKTPGASKNAPAKGVLNIELLVSEKVKEGKCYLVDRKEPAIDTAALAQFLKDHYADYEGIDIHLSDQSVGESHQSVRQLQSMAQEHELRTRIVPPG